MLRHRLGRDAGRLDVSSLAAAGETVGQFGLTTCRGQVRRAAQEASARHSCSSVHCRGDLSGRHRTRLVPCRKRSPPGSDRSALLPPELGRNGSQALRALAAPTTGRARLHAAEPRRCRQLLETFLVEAGLVGCGDGGSETDMMQKALFVTKAQAAARPTNPPARVIAKAADHAVRRAQGLTFEVARTPGR